MGSVVTINQVIILLVFRKCLETSRERHKELGCVNSNAMLRAVCQVNLSSVETSKLTMELG